MSKPTKIINQITKSVNEIFNDESLLALDETALPDDYVYNTWKEKFLVFAKNKNFELIDEYVDANTPIKIECLNCKTTITVTPKKIKTRGCPHCKQLLRNCATYRKQWTRSKQIIKDKMGKIVLAPDFDPNETPSTKIKFILVCHHGHRFTTSHAQLYNNHWCPICGKATVEGFSKLTSKAVYSNKMSLENKETRYRQVCLQKGMQITGKLKNNAYPLTCNTCQTKTNKTAIQILKQVYLCENRCVKGSVVPLNPIANWKWKE